MARIHTVPGSSGADRALHGVWSLRTELLSAALTPPPRWTARRLRQLGRAETLDTR
jgi:hypothetical protein